MEGKVFTHQHIQEIMEENAEFQKINILAVEAIEEAHSALKYWQEGRESSADAFAILEAALKKIHGRE